MPHLVWENRASHHGHTGHQCLDWRGWELLQTAFHAALDGAPKPACRVPLWDEKASERIADILAEQVS